MKNRESKRGYIAQVTVLSVSYISSEQLPISCREICLPGAVSRKNIYEVRSVRSSSFLSATRTAAAVVRVGELQQYVAFGCLLRVYKNISGACSDGGRHFGGERVGWLELRYTRPCMYLEQQRGPALL